MDAEIAELERRLEAEQSPPEQLRLELARAYARSGCREEAWLLYRELQLEDAELSELGRALRALEEPLIQACATWISVQPSDPYGPAESLSVSLPTVEEAEVGPVPALPFVRKVTFRGGPVSESLAACFLDLPRLEAVELDGRGSEVTLLEASSLQALTCLPQLSTLVISEYFLAPGCLQPLGALADRLCELRLVWLRRLEAMVAELNVLSELSRLKTLGIRVLALPDHVLDQLPASLTTIDLRRVQLEGDAALKRLLGRPELRAVHLDSIEALEDPSWLAGLNNQLEVLEVQRVWWTPAREVARRAAQLPQLRILRLGIRSSDEDLQPLAELTQLRELELNGPLNDAGLVAIEAALRGLEAFTARDSDIGAEGLGVIARSFHGRYLQLDVDRILPEHVQILSELEAEYVMLRVSPLTQRVAEEVTDSLRRPGRFFAVKGMPSRYGHEGRYMRGMLGIEVLTLAQLALDLPDLVLETTWAQVPGPERMRDLLEDAYGITDEDALGDTVEDAILWVQARLAP